jgi:hypothetical protein
LPARLALQETLAVPEPPVIVPGLIAPQVRPAGIVSVTLTAPANPLRGDTVIVDIIGEFTLPDPEVAVIVKLTNLKIAVVE